ncbi:outer membrane biogenesis protein BamB [Rubripirellula lacrimiformis]|uniref:Outer membrane biogenesis protein BamB n=1 Tax=Rubripirellula lacrimiformis TaxID=1930273 RepID=A0A517NA30_9BACT|nr:PQQ-binding-like beta-propeller repeat protein [Rubripirellula lacrimiformis]QDT03991.1 outer membrane biogenesis protein BamB [Rubripirellula lacrimiformis]
MLRCLIAATCFFIATVELFADDWPEFLGPGGTAKSADVVPITWSDSENLAWKQDLPGSGSSSPIVVGDQVIVTCYVSGDEAKRQVISFDKSTGNQQWSVDFPINYREDGYQGYITEHGYASNTPVSDGQNVYVFLGKGGVHCISLAGTKMWSFDVGKGSSNRQWGSASSPVLYQDKLFVNAAEEAKAILCLEKTTGKELWRTDADMLELTYGTPRIVRLDNAKVELVISVPEEIWALNPDTGKLNWYASSPMTGNVSPSVIVDGNTIYSFGGYRASGSIAVNAGGGTGQEKDVTDTHVRWTNPSSSYVATPLLHDGRLYWIDDRGIAYCTSAKDGEVIYRARVSNLENGRPVYASPILIGKHIYVVTRRSGTIVFSPGESFSPETQNKFASDETDFNASPAVSDGKLYLRSNQSLYCIERK